MIDTGSPFFALYSDLQKSLDPEDNTFQVEFTDAAHKQLRKMGPEYQKRAKTVASRVHGTAIHNPNPHLDRLEVPQLRAMGGDANSRNQYVMKDYRIRMIASREGNRLIVNDVTTRENSKRTGRTRQ